MPVKNLASLQAKIARIPAAVRADVKKAVDQNAADMAGLAKRLAPKKTGKLAASIHTEPGDTDISTRVAVDAFYGRFVEFGTRSGSIGDTADFTDRSTLGAGTTSQKRRRKVKRNHPGTKAQPFFWPAYRALKKTMKGRVTRAATKALKTTAGSK